MTSTWPIRLLCSAKWQHVLFVRLLACPALSLILSRFDSLSVCPFHVSTARGFSIVFFLSRRIVSALSYFPDSRNSQSVSMESTPSFDLLGCLVFLARVQVLAVLASCFSLSFCGFVIL